MTIRWPRLWIPPVNLWNAPKMEKRMDNEALHVTPWEMNQRINEWERRARDAEEERNDLLDGYPEGMTPSDVVTIREANAEMAQELFELKAERAQAIQQAVKQARREWAAQASDAVKAEWQAEIARSVADSIRYDYEGEKHQDRIAEFVDEIAAAICRQAEATP